MGEIVEYLLLSTPGGAGLVPFRVQFRIKNKKTLIFIKVSLELADGIEPPTC